MPQKFLVLGSPGRSKFCRITTNKIKGQQVETRIKKEVKPESNNTVTNRKNKVT